MILLSNVLYHREFILSMSCNKKAFDNYLIESFSIFNFCKSSITVLYPPKQRLLDFSAPTARFPAMAQIISPLLYSASEYDIIYTSLTSGITDKMNFVCDYDIIIVN